MICCNLHNHSLDTKNLLPLLDKTMLGMALPKNTMHDEIDVFSKNDLHTDIVFENLLIWNMFLYKSNFLCY